jgi:hypothetical protein
MRITCFIPAIILILAFSCTTPVKKQKVTTGSLLSEMVNLERLTRLPAESYKTVQYSSYDRRSISPADSDWFSNEDGFGGEPIPGFEEVLKKPDSTGVGEYLICDVQKPGAILRLWTAGLEGRIRLFIDNVNSPVFEGNAQEFFWKTIDKLSGSDGQIDYNNTFRQFDATYFPIPFSSRCRIEWIGDIKKMHFYHVGLRIYNPGVRVESFTINDFQKYSQKLKEINTSLKNPESSDTLKVKNAQLSEVSIAPGSAAELFRLSGPKAIDYFSVKLNAGDIENALRKCILTIYFDNSSIPQAEVPLGDFFGAAPGLNPYSSVAFSVHTDGTMICRFIMPFKHQAKILINNNSTEEISVRSLINTSGYNWEDGKSMHFGARWKIDHGLTASYFGASRTRVSDITYMMAIGKGRVVGAASYLYNPSNAVTSWGNWWGEGDEKIFVDKDTFPSFFGTGSEDYFNYSWSSAKIFSSPYCGQPRNDGPGNRGYVSNFRWHISDDILFQNNLAFYMELGHHGIVPGFSYGRIVYLYSLPGLIDDYRKISMNDIVKPPYTIWEPEAYLGSAGNRFVQAENLLSSGSNCRVEDGQICAGGKILMWSPVKEKERIIFRFRSDKEIEKTSIGLTLAHSPDGGTVSVFLNGKLLKYGDNETISLFEPDHQILDNHFSERVTIVKGLNEITIESRSEIPGKKAGVDFIWFKQH